MSARSETFRLYRSFLRLRHQFPNKQARSILRRWITWHFSLKQHDYQQLVSSKGQANADQAASQWREEGLKQLGKQETIFTIPFLGIKLWSNAILPLLTLQQTQHSGRK